MTEMMSLLRTGTTAGTHNQRTTRITRGRHGGRTTDCNGGRGRGTAPAPRAYCWSHGACANSSGLCNYHLPGHQTSATFANMQGRNGQLFLAPSLTAWAYRRESISTYFASPFCS